MPQWSADQRAQIETFRKLMLAENELQNLTRQTSDEQFFWGHVWDVAQLLRTGWVSGHLVDLGSGGGVPGLLAAALSPEKWTLVDSEQRKAAFLSATADKMELANVEAVGERVENVLPKLKVDAVVARAVGPVSRIWAWIGKCSTWNTLILFKGPSWDEEWKAFQADYPRVKLRIQDEVNYIAPSPEGDRTRKLLRLTR